VSFGTGEAPRLDPALVDHALDYRARTPDRLESVCETVRRITAALSPETTFLGLAGSPWTVATYMAAGKVAATSTRRAASPIAPPGRSCASPMLSSI
jgi:uroporphyrinogen decarboxylase